MYFLDGVRVDLTSLIITFFYNLVSFAFQKCREANFYLDDSNFDLVVVLLGFIWSSPETSDI